MKINPFWSYIFSFSVSLIAYQLGWSKIYTPLGWTLITFILITFVFHFFSGWLWRRKSVTFDLAKEEINSIGVTVFIYCLWCIEFIHAKGIPLLKILRHENFDYILFGVPTLHVFVVTFSSFYTIFLFHLYLTNHKKLLFILFLINLSAALLIYNRGMLTFNLMACFFLYVNKVRAFSPRLIVIALVGVIGFLYFFGLLGNIRQSAKYKSAYDPRHFSNVGQPTERFKNSFVPVEFFWSYIYLTSPLANLQTNIQSSGKDSSNVSLLKLINNEMLPDFISKRINKWCNWSGPKEFLIPGPFNVSTVYSSSFSYMGWSGLVLMAVFILVVPWIYLWLLPPNPYALTGVSILAAIYLFLIFDNTLSFTGFGFQLVYPFVFPFFLTCHLWIKKKIKG